MTTYAVYADFELLAKVSDEALTRACDALNIADEEACVWRDEPDSSIIRFSFDLDAGTFDEARLATQRILDALPPLGLDGRVSHIEAMTETHTAKWGPDDL